jgi:uncharacterized protein with PIN domain
MRLDSLIIKCPKCNEYNRELKSDGFHLITREYAFFYFCKSCRHFWWVITKISKSHNQNDW